MENGVIQRIIDLQDSDGDLFINKFTVQSILHNLQRQQIEVAELFTRYKKDGFQMLQFVRFFLSIIGHRNVQTLYLTIGLVDLFNTVSKQLHKNRVTLRDITDYMCQRIFQNAAEFKTIQAKLLPRMQFITPAQEKRRCLQDLPVIYGEQSSHIYKLCSKSIKTDSSKHSRSIVTSQFSPSLHKTFILQSLSDSIQIYNENCHQIGKITPNSSKLKKEVVILSFAFSHRQLRLGAVLRDFTIRFWDNCNDFTYQKTLLSTSYCQQLQTAIYFLETFNYWLTTEKTGAICVWNLLEDKLDRKLVAKYCSPINDLCQIGHLNLLLLAQEHKRQQNSQDRSEQQTGGSSRILLYNFYTGCLVTQISLGNDRIPHTIRYSAKYQVLFTCGLEKKVKIYEINQAFMDAGCKGELVGHENLITAFCLVADSPLLVSADDKGKLKLWDFRNFTCLQTIDFSDKTAIGNLLDMAAIGKIGVFGSRVNYISFQGNIANLVCPQTRANQSEDRPCLEKVDIDIRFGQLFLFLASKMQVLDLYTGRVLRIFDLSPRHEEEDYTYFRYFSSIRKFVLGTARGDISLHKADTGQMEALFKSSHNTLISHVEYDQLNKLFLTVGVDGRILIHTEKERELLRDIRCNFAQGQLTCTELSVYHNLIAVGSHSDIIYLWNYEYGKLFGQLRIHNCEPNCMHFLNGFSLLLVSTSDCKLMAYKINQSSDAPFELMSCRTLPHIVTEITSDIDLRGKQKTRVNECNVTLLFDNGAIGEIDLTSILQQCQFIPHCSTKANYYPYREGRELFSKSSQKTKLYPVNICGSQSGWNLHTLCRINASSTEKKQSLRTFTLDHRYRLFVAKQRRIQICDSQDRVICDMNINYPLPYKWQLRQSESQNLIDKVYFGITLIQAISKKYTTEISTGEAGCIQIKDLLCYVQNAESNNVYQPVSHVPKDAEDQQNMPIMLTEPLCQTKKSTIAVKHANRKVVLLQNEYTRKDLNFELVKQYNFTEIAGQSLKEIDHMKCIRNIQDEWRHKEQECEEEKVLLQKQIRLRALRNEEKDQVQNLLIKNTKKANGIDSQALNKNHRFYRELTNIEANLLGTRVKTGEIGRFDMKTQSKTDMAKTWGTMRATDKNRASYIAGFFGTDNFPMTSQGRLYPSRTLPRKFKQISFEDYYLRRNESSSSSGFRQILTEMNGRIRVARRHKKSD